MIARTILVVVTVWSSAALAQPSGAQAEVLFRQGRDLLAAGKVADACVAFEESQKLQPAVTTLLNLAGCREKLGQIATAWGLFLDAVRDTRSATDAAGQQLHGVAQAHADKLEPRVSRLTINVPQQSQVEGLEITRGQERVEPALWNRALPIDGGTYTITARAPGANPWLTRVTITDEGDIKTVQVPDLRNLPRDLGKPAPPRPPVTVTAAEPAPASARPSRPVIPLVVGAGALTLLGAGLGFELWGDSKYNAAKSELASQSRRQALYDAATTRRYTAEALAACGLAAGGAALWLYRRDRNHERDAVTSTHLRVIPSATGLALAGQF
jgi:serine/threonine-protein kinase